MTTQTPPTQPSNAGAVDARPLGGTTTVCSSVVRVLGGAIALDVSPLLNWQHDGDVKDFLTDLRDQAQGGPAVAAFELLLVRVKEAVEAHVRTSTPKPAAAGKSTGSSGSGNGSGSSSTSGSLQEAVMDGRQELQDGDRENPVEDRSQEQLPEDRPAGVADTTTSTISTTSTSTTAAAAAAAVGSLSELCWEKLHLGYWKDVHLAWRNGYILICVLDVVLRLLNAPSNDGSTTHPNSLNCRSLNQAGNPPAAEPRIAADGVPVSVYDSSPNACRKGRAAVAAAEGAGPAALLSDCCRQLDLGLMMGGPLWRSYTHRLVDCLHEAMGGEAGETTVGNEEEGEEGAAGQVCTTRGMRIVRPPDTGTVQEGVAAPVDEEGGGGGGSDGGRFVKRRRIGVSVGVIEAGSDDDGAYGSRGGGGDDVMEGACGGSGGGERSSKTHAVRLPPGSLGGPPGCRVPVSELPDLEEFLLSFMTPGRPVVLLGAMEHWPALSRWRDMSYLERVAGSRTVPVEVGQHYLAQGWGQQLMTLRDFLTTHINRQPPPPPPLQLSSEITAGVAAPTTGASSADQHPTANDTSTTPSPSNPTTTPLGYLAQHPLFDQVPVLRADIITPDYCCLGEGEVVAVNSWLGPGGTTTPLHTDPHHNLLAQVVGRKYVRVYDPALTPHLYPNPAGSVNSNSSQIDLDCIELHDGDGDGGGEGGDGGGGGARFPGVGSLPYQDVVLEPGQMLYIPPGWWHFVRSLSTSFSVSFWWR